MMGLYKSLCVVLCLLFMAKSEPSNLCGPQLQDKCFCGIKHYDGNAMYTVECTNTGFVDADILKHLPKQTEMLIFNGNNFSSLPWNIFGEQENLPNLHTINLANNNIVEIPGKAFHHVSNVKRLILNNNKIRLSPGRSTEHVHIRMFSSFSSLEELQLINAFDDNPDEEITSALRDIFYNSNLSKLTKLYLSDNKLTSIEDALAFCDLQELRELYLDGNQLTDINFNISCLHRLQFLSLKNNRIHALRDQTYRMLDSFPARGQALEIDLQLNPWLCKEEWLNATKVKFRESTGGVGCLLERDVSKNSRISVVGQILIALTILCIFIVVGVLYSKRTQIRSKFNPLTDSVSQKMQYTTLRRRDDPEVEV